MSYIALGTGKCKLTPILAAYEQAEYRNATSFVAQQLDEVNIKPYLQSVNILQVPVILLNYSSPPFFCKENYALNLTGFLVTLVLFVCPAETF